MQSLDDHAEITGSLFGVIMFSKMASVCV